jgi:LmbE family N-acetylglucosaminyl deacetylase
MKIVHFFAAFLIISFFCLLTDVRAQNNSKLRIIMIGAHPDDCDQDGGGTAILFAKLGHAVKFVSVTNGDAGHQTMKGAELAKRRLAEAKEAGKRFGVEYDVLDNHDGELLPSLEVRLQIIRKIREWNADIVIAPRPNDYHPDHRYTGVLVQDAAYMVAVPNLAPGTPALTKNPVFLYFQDGFKRPNPFRPDIAVDISEVYAQKVHAKGLITFLDEQGLEKVLRKTTLYFENNNSNSSTVFDNLSTDYTQKLMKAIVAFEVEVQEFDNVFKLSQNRDHASFEGIKEKLNTGDSDAKTIAAEMEKRTSELYAGANNKCV